MINLSTKFDISTFTQGMHNIKTWVVLGGKASTRLIGNISIQYSVYNFLFNFNTNYASI